MLADSPGRRTDVHGDDDLGAHLLRDIHRQIAGDPTVDEQPSVDLDRREDRGNRHARAHRHRQLPAVKNDHFARIEIRRDGAIGNTQIVEVVHARDGERQASKDELDPRGGRET